MTETTEPGTATAARGGDRPFGPLLIFLGLIAIFGGVFAYVQSRNESADEAAAGVGVALQNLDRAKAGLPLLDEPTHEPNTVALAAGVGGGAALILIGALVLSSERRHRETLAAIERSGAPPA